MSSCLSGGATYTFELKMKKSPPSRAASSHNTPSPSSTISESNSPPFTISTRRPRTRRKRPNQTYNEAAALLSTAYPNIFSSKRITPSDTLFLGFKSPLSDYDEPSQLLLPFETIEEVFNPTIQTKPYQFLEQKEVTFNSEVNLIELFDDFDAESIILDEEIEEGLDSLMGSNESNEGECTTMPWYGSFIGSGSVGNLPLGLGLRSSLREEDDDASLCRYPTVELEHISPRFQTTATAAELADDGKSDATVAVVKKKRTKRKKKVAAAAAESKSVEEDLKLEKRVSLFLKLDYDRVLEAWSDKVSPFSDEILGSHATDIDIHAMLAEIDLFGESGVREASVLRYKEKRRSRLVSNSKQIRYQIRKHSADQRPRMKGRFVRRPNVLSGLRL